MLDPAQRIKLAPVNARCGVVGDVTRLLSHTHRVAADTVFAVLSVLALSGFRAVVAVPERRP